MRKPGPKNSPRRKKLKLKKVSSDLQSLLKARKVQASRASARQRRSY
jgi:hypothetical protein